MGAAAQLFEAALQPGGAAGKPAGAVFEARAPRGEAFEGAVQLDRDVAHAPTLSRSAARTRASSRCCCAMPRSDGSLVGRRFEFVGKAPGAPQGLAAEAGNERVEFDFQGKAGARRLSLTGGEARGALARRSRASLARAPPAAARSSASASTPAPAPARSEPTPSSPLPLAARESPARSFATAAAARRRLGPSAASCAGRRAPRTRAARRARAAAGRRAGSAPGRSPLAPPGARRCGAAPGRAGRAVAGS